MAFMKPSMPSLSAKDYLASKRPDRKLEAMARPGGGGPTAALIGKKPGKPEKPGPVTAAKKLLGQG